MALRIGVTLKAFKDVVGLKTQLSGAFGSSDGTNATAAKQHQFFAAANGVNTRVEITTHLHARPLLERQRHSAGYKTNPDSFSVGANINQHRLPGLNPIKGLLHCNVTAIAKV